MVYIAQRVCYGARTSGHASGWRARGGHHFLVCLSNCQFVGVQGTSLEYSGVLWVAKRGSRRPEPPARLWQQGQKAAYSRAETTTLSRFRDLHTSMGLCYALFSARRDGTGALSLPAALGCEPYGRAAVQRASSAFRGAADAPDGRRAGFVSPVSRSLERSTSRCRTERAAGEWPPCAARHGGRHPASPRTRSDASGRCEAV